VGAPGYGVPKSNTKAVVSLVIGIVSLPLGLCCSVFGLLGIAAIVLGNQAGKEIEGSPGLQTGAGMARAGVILGIVGTVIAVIMAILSAVVTHNGGLGMIR
jgi:hypothetical protein